MSEPDFLINGLTEPILSWDGKCDWWKERFAKRAIEGEKKLAHSLRSEMGMKSELEDLFLSFCITLNTEVGVTSENFENSGENSQ